jgi:hypothetical protein
MHIEQEEDKHGKIATALRKLLHGRAFGLLKQATGLPVSLEFLNRTRTRRR